MKNETIEIYGGMKKRVTKNTAQKVFEDGNTVYICPCNANPNSPWINALPIQKDSTEDFTKLVNEYEYYNCNNELGLYSKFYISNNL